jgi:hypothetical protein
VRPRGARRSRTHSREVNFKKNWEFGVQAALKGCVPQLPISPFPKK